MDQTTQFTVFNILKTMTVDYYHYIDVITLDGNVSTQLMKKIAEPNEFAIAHSFPGDDIDSMVEYFKNDYENDTKGISE